LTDTPDPPGAPLLELEGVDVRYGRIAAVKGVSVTLADGEIVAMLGANGAGKSSLMRAIAGLEPVAAGAVRFRGKSLVGMPAHKRVGLGIALVPEGRSVFGPLTVRENLRLGMLSRGFFVAAAEFDAHMEEVLALFPVLRQRQSVRAGELSGGQQQMLAIARALMSRPTLLLLDEPSLGLAPVIVEELFAKLVELNERAGLSVILAEQNIDNALAISDRAYVFEVGQVALTGPAAELRHRSDVEDVYLGRSTLRGHP
jgi:branched-chain amino acid transport system ATP-binding protein